MDCGLWAVGCGLPDQLLTQLKCGTRRAASSKSQLGDAVAAAALQHFVDSFAKRARRKTINTQQVLESVKRGEA